MDYAELYNYITQYTENQEASFLANIPLFVQLTEENIYRNANLPLQSKVVSLVATAGANTVTIPSDFLNFDYVYVIDGTGKYQILLNKETDFIYQAYSDPTYQTLPLYYAIRDAYTIILGPTPDQAYNLSTQYVYVPESIVTAGTSWLGDNAQNALLYGSLAQAYTYMKGEDTLMQKYEMMYQDALGKTRELGEGLDRSDAYRTSPPRDLPNGGNNG